MQGAQAELAQEQPRDRVAAHIAREPLLDRLADGGTEPGGVGARSRRREPQEPVGNRVVVAVDERPEDESHPSPRPPVEPTEHAEVEEGDAVTRQEEEVARVRIGVEEAVDEDLPYHRVRRDAQERFGVESRRAQLVRRRRAQPLDKLHRQHARRRTRPVHCGHDDARVPGEELAHALGGPRLAPEVELAAGVVGELGDRRGRPEGERLRAPALDPAGEKPEQREVALDLLGDPGPLHLDRDRAPIRENGPVHLRQRRGRERLALELGEEVRERSAELALDDSFGDVAGERRHRVVERAQRLRVRKRNIVRPQREHLPRFDERRPQPLEHPAHPLRQRQLHPGVMRTLFESDRAVQPAPRRDARAQPERRDQPPELSCRERCCDLRCAGELGAAAEERPHGARAPSATARPGRSRCVLASNAPLARTSAVATWKFRRRPRIVIAGSMRKNSSPNIRPSP